MKNFLFVILLTCSINILAQDVIVKKDCSTILSKVLEVNTTDIKYKKFSNQNGPTYTIPKADIMSINYENGEIDSFYGNDSKTKVNNDSNSSQRLIKKTADDRNAEIISLYNQKYEPTSIAKNNSVAKEFLIIFGVKSSSIMSNEDIEMTFVRERIRSPYGGKYTIYNINLKNKTNKTIYVDKGNCFRVIHDGTFHCYYDNTEQTTVNLGGASGASLGVGSVVGALGINGTIGQIASGVSVGGGTSHSVSTTYSQQRVIAIPPHGNRNLSEEKWVQTKKANLLSDAEYKTVDKAENFELWGKSSGFGLKRGMVKRGQVRYFNENEIPWKREYIITYSTEEDFKTYSSLNAELYIHEIIGCSTWIDNNNSGKYLNGVNEYTIEGCHHTWQ